MACTWLKVSHIDSKAVDEFMTWINETYGRKGEVKTKVIFINIVAWTLITHEEQDLYGRLSEYHGWIISIQVGGA